MPKDMALFQRMKQAGQPISMLTCYDYPTAVLEERAGIDVLLVGDSVGTNVLGYRSEVEVTLQDICQHVRAVRRGRSDAYLLADLPYHTYEDEESALRSAREIMSCGADGVKLEGMRPRIVAYLHGAGIDVCAHIGLSMQAEDTVGIKGKTFEQAREFTLGAIALERAGAKMIVLELMPLELSRAITERLVIPTIGIGAGPHTDGQVLVIHDLLGITPRAMRHAKRYLDLGRGLEDAFVHFHEDVQLRRFPTEANCRAMPAEERSRFLEWDSKPRA